MDARRVGGGRIGATRRALPLPMRITNGLAMVSLVLSSFDLLRLCSDRGRPLRFPLGGRELATVVCQLASVVYLLSLFAHSDAPATSGDDDEGGPAADAEPAPMHGAGMEGGDEEIVAAVVSGALPSHRLESRLGDCRRAARLRREALRRVTGRGVEGLPFEGMDYQAILGQCCEMPVGYVQLPVGVAGPLILDGREYHVPLATTEGCLVASVNRGCRAIAASGGAISVLLRDAMSRAPAVKLPSAKRAAELKAFVEAPANFELLASVFNRFIFPITIQLIACLGSVMVPMATFLPFCIFAVYSSRTYRAKCSRFGRLQDIHCALAGRNLYMRFTCITGDAMGMNMVSKGVENVLGYLRNDFPDMDIISISGNYCSDKKPTAVNWIEGRGKSVVCEATIKRDVVQKVLKTTTEKLVELNIIKNLAGSAVAGALGGFNAHASNIVTALFIATGQDPAQNVESSQCITMLETVNDGDDLHISVTMPSIEVGTIGGGTCLASQAACLNLLGVKGSIHDLPGANAQRLATIVAGSVLAGELSLLAALAAGQLVKSHMEYNRSSKDITKAAS
ncbi:3-hydroxy-3-methylglutaryl-coenzyme A reductase 1 isoform X1 [Oryza brachyantha]|uniref:3-hydroxy-3-methylglutaryl-coenzyme A reductase 1 isoform X1 n=1 Tax=Oryza brachyantha TaxID=4533 RepID=UPI001ADB96EB|nr:3-hydroxy-3-methylglutaryl-coenzyme A reductase 1 isoform X1 [Oryza brachyantha]